MEQFRCLCSMMTLVMWKNPGMSQTSFYTSNTKQAGLQQRLGFSQFTFSLFTFLTGKLLEPIPASSDSQ